MAKIIRSMLIWLALCMVSACGTELIAEPAALPTPTAVPTRLPYDPDNLVVVERRDLLEVVTGRASVEPKLTDELFFKRDGRLASIEFSDGDQVEKGQVLAKLEQTDLLYQIELAEIDVDLAELREREVREQDASEIELALAAKEVERAELALERLQSERQSLEITAPYPGRISRIEADVGDEVTAFEPLMSIVGTEELVLLAEFSGAKAARVTTGASIRVEDFFDATKAFTATVAGQIEAGTRLVLEPAADAPEYALGDSFKVTAVLGRAESVLTLPVSAVKTIGERRYVLLVDSGEVRRVFVETGIESEGIVEISSGIEEGQQVSER